MALLSNFLNICTSQRVSSQIRISPYHLINGSCSNYLTQDCKILTVNASFDLQKLGVHLFFPLIHMYLVIIKLENVDI